MTTLSSAGWVIHDVGLATAIGGTVYELAAMSPALEHSRNTPERDRISIEAAERFSLLKLLSHAGFAVPWIVGRTMRSGSEVSAEARLLTKAKDVLVGVSLVSGLIGLFAVKKARNRIERGPVDVNQGVDRNERPVPLKSTPLATLAVINVVANVGILGITALLAMQASKSVRFAASSRQLP